ncbi:LysE family translocator [Paenibacillus qinlingensis]|uniref:LysE family translocator n=1 Tax=Paenibacillus qinlingensis TaxID=1837343 RepID=UPI0015641100|nr:LysE family translocator [Paenibacillus qinlingensis]NQX59504.1 LysE family transporter [Paenibacillus qinlingensis]
MDAFITYVFLGISLSAPIGPINAAQLDKGARFGFTQAWLIGLGAMCADLLYMLLIYFGLAHFLTTPFMKTFLWLFGCFVLIYTGIDTLRNVKVTQEANPRDAQSSGVSSFRSGFIMALTNPLNILFWLGIYGSILAESVQNYGLTQVLWHTSGIFAGILLWDVAMATLASSFHKFGNRTTLQIISIIAGLSLIGFGMYFGYQAYKQLLG